MKKILSLAFVITLMNGGEVWGSSMHQDLREGYVSNDVHQTVRYYAHKNGMPYEHALGSCLGILGDCLIYKK